MFKRLNYILIGLHVLFFINQLLSQDIPIDLNHPVNDFILRYHSLGVVTTIHPGLRPFNQKQILDALNEISSKEFAVHELTQVNYYKKEFDFTRINNGLTGPWQKRQLAGTIRKTFSTYNLKTNEIRFLSYKDEELILWADWEEFFSGDIHDTIMRSFYNDKVTISGYFTNQLSFYSQYSLFRVGFNEGHPHPEEFKQGFAFVEENTSWLVWDISQASLKWNNSIINFELSKIPIYWGLSKKHSPILSANVQPYPFLRFSKRFKQVRVQSFLGVLSPFGDNRKGVVEEKNIAAHRFEIDLTQSLTVSFNEMVIYARRNLELGYLLPVNLMMSEEHGLGNRDNVLMSVDALWKVKQGLTVYSTLFWDELAWFKLFTSWWANKFIFQTGAHFVPFENPKLPDFRVEFTVSRPWVYTHKDTLLNYTSATYGLGFPIGPNSQLFVVEMNMWPTNILFLSLNAAYLKKGSGIGSNANDNYNDRDRTLDENTPFLLGHINKNIEVGLKLKYRIAELLYLTGDFSYDDKNNVAGRVGVLINY